MTQTGYTKFQADRNKAVVSTVDSRLGAEQDGHAGGTRRPNLPQAVERE